MERLIPDYQYSDLIVEGFDYHSKLKELEYAKKAFQKEGNEQFANECWRQRNRVRIFFDFVTMFTQFQSNQFYEAWCTAEKIEIAANFLLQNFPEDKGIIASLLKRVNDFQNLFPYRVFSSTVFKEKKIKCTICGEEVNPWSSCKHQVGRVYNGELCLREVVDVDIISIDLVTNPQHKYAVVFLKNDDNTTKDHYDYSILKGLQKHWISAFQEWECDITTEYIKAPQGIKDDDLCPCNFSFEKYKDCCKNRAGIRSLRYHFRI